MSGDSMDWVRDDELSNGEGVPRCDRAGCNSPLELYIGTTLILERCGHFHHVQHAQLVYPEDFAAA